MSIPVKSTGASSFWGQLADDKAFKRGGVTYTAASGNDPAKVEIDSSKTLGGAFATDIPRLVGDNLAMDRSAAIVTLKNKILKEPKEAGEFQAWINSSRQELRRSVYEFTNNYALILFSFGLFDTEAAVSEASRVGRMMIASTDEKFSEIAEMILEATPTSSASDKYNFSVPKEINKIPDDAKPTQGAPTRAQRTFPQANE